MTIIEVLQASPPLFILFIAMLGLIVGSFINVVIYRLPLILNQQWQQQCAQLTGQAVSKSEHFSLSQPRSRCPHCGHPISALENIPLISYLVLAGKCKACNATISPRYPLIELLTALLSVLVAWQFGVTWACVAGLMFTWSLIALTFIDIDQQLLPDDITLPLLWLGIIVNLFNVFTDLSASVIGAIAGYLSLWLVFQLFKLATGKEGMGYGDFKLLAALGAWFGWQVLPTIILLSSLVGAIVGIALLTIKQQQRDTPIPFGPYLAAAGWVVLMWGNSIQQFYTSWFYQV